MCRHVRPNSAEFCHWQGVMVQVLQPASHHCKLEQSQHMLHPPRVHSLMIPQRVAHQHQICM